jgi:hypothetical protein
MRFLLSAVLGGCTVFAQADRILNVPIGRSLPFHVLRTETLFGLNERGSREQFMAFTLFSGVEVELRNRNRDDDRGNTTADFAYNLISPVASLSPGVSFGILDSANKSLDGSRGYMAITFREMFDIGQVGEAGDVTIGFQFGSLNSGFWGASLPISGRTRLLFEHNGARASAGIESNLYPGLNLRIFTQQETLLAGVSYSVRF